MGKKKYVKLLKKACTEWRKQYCDYEDILQVKEVERSGDVIVHSSKREGYIMCISKGCFEYVKLTVVEIGGE